MKPAHVVASVPVAVVSLIALGLAAGGVAAAVPTAHQADNGFISAPTAAFSADSYALTSAKLDLAATAGIPADIAGIRLEATGTNEDLFIGIAPQAEVDRYLATVHHTELVDVSLVPFRADYRDVAGTQVPALPGDQGWWTVSASGTGTQQVIWDVRPGNWAVVVMNADASPNLSVALRAGARPRLHWPVSVGLTVGGILLPVLGIVWVVLGSRGDRRARPAPPSPTRIGGRNASGAARIGRPDRNHPGRCRPGHQEMAPGRIWCFIGKYEG